MLCFHYHSTRVDPFSLTMFVSRIKRKKRHILHIIQDKMTLFLLGAERNMVNQGNMESIIGTLKTRRTRTIFL